MAAPAFVLAFQSLVNGTSPLNKKSEVDSEQNKKRLTQQKFDFFLFTLEHDIGDVDL